VSPTLPNPTPGSSAMAFARDARRDAGFAFAPPRIRIHRHHIVVLGCAAFEEARPACASAHSHNGWAAQSRAPGARSASHVEIQRQRLAAAITPAAGVTENRTYNVRAMRSITGITRSRSTIHRRPPRRAARLSRVDECRPSATMVAARSTAGFRTCVACHVGDGMGSH